MFAGLGVGDVIDGHFVVIFWSVGHLGEFHAVEFFSHGKDAVAHRVECKVFAHFRFVKVIFFLTYFFGIVIIVPGCDLEASVVLVDDGLHLGHFLFDFLDCGSPDLHEQRLGIVDSLGHDIVCHV